MATRKIVRIDEELCNGCGECVPSCAEGAIQIIDGKAKLVADNLCDGLGACLGDCPMDAITIEEREADAFDEEAVEAHMETLNKPARPVAPSPLHVHGHGGGGGCPGSRALAFGVGNASDAPSGPDGEVASELRQWPVQMHLVSPMAPYFQGADVLLAADCVAFSVGDFHQKFLKGKALAIACPKLDDGMDIYLDKMVAMVDQARINTLTVMIMEVPCCGGLMALAKEAVSRASRNIPIKKMVVGIRGDILSEDWA